MVRIHMTSLFIFILAKPEAQVKVGRTGERREDGPAVPSASVCNPELLAEERLRREEMPETGANLYASMSSENLTLTKIDALYECCNAFYKNNGDGASTVSCPKPDLLR
jgi:hypothetical protein